MLFLRQLAPCIGRIEFTFVWDHSFASDNSPPHIAATQYSLATHLERVFRWTQTFTGWFHGFISVRRGVARNARVRVKDNWVALANSGSCQQLPSKSRRAARVGPDLRAGRFLAGRVRPSGL